MNNRYYMLNYKIFSNILSCKLKSSITYHSFVHSSLKIDYDLLGITRKTKVKKVRQVLVLIELWRKSGQ